MQAGIGEREQRLTLGLRLEESPSGQFLARFLQPILPNSPFRLFRLADLPWRGQSTFGTIAVSFGTP